MSHNIEQLDHYSQTNAWDDVPDAAKGLLGDLANEVMFANAETQSLINSISGATPLLVHSQDFYLMPKKTWMQICYAVDRITNGGDDNG